MKILKLDSNFKDARKIANCLIGTATTDKDDPFGHYGDLIYVSELHEEFVLENRFQTKEIIYLHIGGLKFCPFMAMRERVQVDCQSIDLPFLQERGTLNGSQNVNYFSLNKGDYYHFNEIKLDLGPIERGELQGCEIVEVECE